MVEKTGHKKFMRLKRMEWIDEGKPKPPQDNEDEDIFGQPEEQRDPARFPARVAPIFQNATSNRPSTPDIDDLFGGGEDDIYDATPRAPKSVATAQLATGASAQQGGEPDEDDLDALMAEEEASRTIPTSIFGNGGATAKRAEPDEDDLDALMAEEEASRTAPCSIFGNGGPPAKRLEPKEDDLEALMAEAEANKASKPAVSTKASQTPAPVTSEEEGEDLDALIAEAEGRAPSAGKADTEANPAQEPEVGINEDEEEAMAEMDGLW
jgi:replication fork protection complex subunit Csm3/Swi3